MPLKILDVSNSYSKQHKALLNDNPIGTPGASMVYQHRRVNDKLAHIRMPWFVNLQRGDKLIGTCCFCEREEINFSNYYIRYFAFLKSFRIDNNQGRFNLKNGAIKTDVDNILSGDYFNSNSSSSVFYAYIDPSNNRSKVICDGFGFQTIRDFKSILMSRFYPKTKVNISKPSNKEKEVIKTLLNIQYKEYNFFNLENLFFDDSYYILKENDEIVAGIQAVKEKWWIRSLPGVSGKLLLKLASGLPLLRKLIKKDFSFLALEGIYCKPGYEGKIELMIESIMAETNQNLAMIALDTKSGIAKLFESYNLGFISKINPSKVNSIIVKTKGEPAIEKYKNKVSYISTLDLT